MSSEPILQAAVAGDNPASEWRGHWTLLIATVFGYSTSVLHIYGIGAFIGPLQHEFGWSRALISSGLTISGIVAGIAAVPLGLLVDRRGARRVALAGVPMMSLAFALLGTATGTVHNWITLWVVVALTNICLQTPVWMSCVSAAFTRSRGLAIALTVSGASLGSSVYPLLATWLIGRWGWRVGFIGMGAIWGVIVLCAVFFFFRDTRHDVPARLVAPARAFSSVVTVEVPFRLDVMLGLALAGGIIAFMALGIIVHFVPILMDRGATQLKAASIAALIGVFSIAGRIGTGILLDRLPGRIVGASACLLPMIASIVLIFNGAHSLAQALAAACFGLMVGAEIDVITYLASRHFIGSKFGLRLGTINTALATGTALGPIAAGFTFDRFGSYVPFLWLTVVLMGACSLSLLSLPKPPVVTPASA